MEAAIFRSWGGDPLRTTTAAVMATITAQLNETQLLDWGIDGNTLWIRVAGLLDNGATDPQCVDFSRVTGEREIDLTDCDPAERPSSDADMVAVWFDPDDTFSVELDELDD